jgi:hypothetical protein
MRARCHLYAGICFLLIPLLGGCGTSTSSSQSPVPPSSTPTTGWAIISPAPEPTQMNAPGITFTTGDLNVVVHNNSFNIPARVWNTITDESVVPRDIGVSLDPTIHASQTSRNRFQYLADRMFPYLGSTFDSLGIVSVVHGSDQISIVAFINPTNNTYQLSNLIVTVIKGPPSKTITSAEFYATPDTTLTIPGNNIYFAWLSSPITASPPKNWVSTTWNFHYGRLYNCGQAVCPQPSN